MLPFDTRDFNKQSTAKSSLMEGKFPDYMRRLCDFRQMDFEAAFDQLLTLVSLEPQQMYVVYFINFTLYLKLTNCPFYLS